MDSRRDASRKTTLEIIEGVSGRGDTEWAVVEVEIGTGIWRNRTAMDSRAEAESWVAWQAEMPIHSEY